jgi:hypothetical protein
MLLTHFSESASHPPDSLNLCLHIWAWVENTVYCVLREIYTLSHSLIYSFIHSLMANSELGLDIGAAEGDRLTGGVRKESTDEIIAGGT